MPIKPAQPRHSQLSIVIQSQRADVLAALTSVDKVVFLAEYIADNLITQLQPDMYVKGGNYSLDPLPEARSVLSSSGKIYLIQVERPTSTTVIIQQIINSSKK